MRACGRDRIAMQCSRVVRCARGGGCARAQSAPARRAANLNSHAPSCGCRHGRCVRCSCSRGRRMMASKRWPRCEGFQHARETAVPHEHEESAATSPKPRRALARAETLLPLLRLFFFKKLAVFLLDANECSRKVSGQCKAHSLHKHCHSIALNHC